MPVILALWRLRQEDCHEFKAIWGWLHNKTLPKKPGVGLGVSDEKEPQSNFESP